MDDVSAPTEPTLFDHLAAIEDGEAREARRVATNLRRAAILPSQYAIKFRLDAGDLDPTDENLARVLEWCALRPKPEWYPAIRAQVLGDRGGYGADPDEVRA